VASSCRAGLLSHRQQCRVRPAERAVACALYHGPLTRHFAAGCLQAAIFGSAPRSAALPPSSLAAALTGAREGRGDGLVGCLTAGSGARLGSRAPAASTRPRRAAARTRPMTRAVAAWAWPRLRWRRSRCCRGGSGPRCTASAARRALRERMRRHGAVQRSLLCLLWQAFPDLTGGPDSPGRLRSSQCGCGLAQRCCGLGSITVVQRAQRVHAPNMLLTVSQVAEPAWLLDRQGRAAT